jgi:hypothetical protein
MQHFLKRSLNLCVVGLATLYLTPFAAFAADIKTSWSADGAPDLAGYKIYYGTSSRNYGKVTTVGNVTSYTLTGMSTGNYYFAVTAYDTSGNESGFSNEASVAISSGLPRCDINADGVSNSLDLQAEINAILAGSSSSSFDINRDNGVNALDLQVLSNVVLGVTSCP